MSYPYQNYPTYPNQRQPQPGDPLLPYGIVPPRGPSPAIGFNMQAAQTMNYPANSFWPTGSPYPSQPTGEFPSVQQPPATMPSPNLPYPNVQSSYSGAPRMDAYPLSSAFSSVQQPPATMPSPNLPYPNVQSSYSSAPRMEAYPLSSAHPPPFNPPAATPLMQTSAPPRYQEGIAPLSYPSLSAQPSSYNTNLHQKPVESQMTASHQFNLGTAPSKVSHQTVAHHPLKVNPTIVPAPGFDPRMDAEILRKAMKGFGTDEKAIIQVLANRTNMQRLEIANHFKTLYGKDLIKELKSELTGRFEELVLACMTPLPQYYALELKEALSGVGTDEACLVEILATASNHYIQVIRSTYQAMFGRSLESELKGDTSGHFRRLMVSLCQGNRDESPTVNQAAATQDAQSLLRAGEKRFGTDESTFNAILVSRSYSHLHQVMAEYERLAGHSLEKAIKKEFSGDVMDGLLAIVKSAANRAHFFAERLHKSMAGMGTKDRTLIRIIVTRSEVDLGDIKTEFHRAYGKSLQEFISGDTSGDYKKMLLAMVG